MSSLRGRLHLDKAQYDPGDTVRLRVSIDDADGCTNALTAKLTVSHLTQVLFEDTSGLGDGPNFGYAFEFCVPEAKRGYGIDVAVTDRDGITLLDLSTAFDVLGHWSEAPRYGFVCDFRPRGQDDDGCREMWQEMTDLHLNVVQFYDWMYRHHQYMPPDDVFCDPQVVRYPWSPSDNPASPWRDHIIAEYERALRDVGFDGIHMDQYGWPWGRYLHGSSSRAAVCWGREPD